MEKSSSIKNIAGALFQFQIKMDKIKKTAENPFFKSKYAPLPEILEAIQIPLNESGLVIAQLPDGEGLTTVIMHPDSGEWIEATGIMHPVKSDPQSMGSAITFQRRYSLAAILCLNIDEDDDGNEASAPAAKPTAPSSQYIKEGNNPWLNEGTPEFEQAKAVIQKATDKAAAFKALRLTYSISKKVAEALAQ
jgi:hypothetical protein